jgi:hypothetical protein
MLPDQARKQYAGSFAADPNALTPARARELADRVVAEWVTRSAQQLAEQASAGQPYTVATLPECLAAVNSGAVGTLLIPGDGMVSGFACGRCGALSVAYDQCADWGTAAYPVPDLLEEMACRVLDDAGQVVTIENPPFQAAAHLRFPLDSQV